MKRSSKSSKPSFPAPQGDGNLSTDRPSAKTFNKKRFWTVIAIVAVIEVLAIALVQQWRYIFPSHEVSDLYTHYEKVEGIDASFIKDFRVNDSVFIDVTMLEATTNSGWDKLKKDFNIPPIHQEDQDCSRHNLTIFYLAPKNDHRASMDSVIINNDMITISRNTQTICVFHITNENQLYNICYLHI